MKKMTGKGMARSVLCMLLATCMVVCSMVVSKTENVQAAANTSANAGSGYKMLLNNNTGENYPVKTGKYYVKQKWTQKSEDVYVSTKKNSGYKKIPYCHTYFIASNGKYAYYADRSSKKQKLYRYTYSTGKVESVGTLPLNKNYKVIYAYGYGIILSSGNASVTGEGNESLYMYNVKTQKLTTLWNKANRVYYVETVSGRYILVNGYNSRDGRNKENLLCEITANGVKVIKKLSSVYVAQSYGTVYNDGSTSYTPSLAADNNKIYCMARSGSNKISVYEFDKTKSKIKRVVTMSFASRSDAENDYAIVKFTNKYCIYRDSWNTCRKVIYSTGKTVKVRYVDVVY